MLCGRNILDVFIEKQKPEMEKSGRKQDRSGVWT